jgi:hypothetical protein
LHLTRHFTLARPLGKGDEVIYVEQPTTDAPMQEDCRVLQFGGELIHYDSYTTEYPYAFLGCKRGHFDTYVTEHPLGQIGGTLDVSEFGATSVYLDQDSSLADEVAEKLAHFYNSDSSRTLDGRTTSSHLCNQIQEGKNQRGN